MVKIKYVLFVVLILLLVSCQEKDYTKLVNPFVGTGGHGHTYPGAVVPFGMVQLSPDTRNDNSWDGCAGYHYSDSAIVGFSHTHLSGVGVPEYCDILFLPFTGDISLNAGTRENPGAGYRSLYRHETEMADPGYYKVTLDDYKVDVELTATTRVGLQRYSFNGDSQPKILLDLIHRDEVTNSVINIKDENSLSGYRFSKDWAGRQKVFFSTQFSIPFLKVQFYQNGIEVQKITDGRGGVQAVFSFPEGVRDIHVKTALSSVSEEGALRNLNEELDHWDFNAVRQQAHDLWNKNLGKIDVEGETTEDLTNFYSSWYHCLVSPNVYSDVDGKYRGMDDQIHQAEGYTHYTIFSLWDTFRTLHPLLTITHPEETRDFVCSLIDKGEQFETYPMWELAGNDTRCMIGYHAVSIITDAFKKGIRDFDHEKALELMLATANKDWRGMKDYREKGFVAANKSSQAVSKTLEYAYDDWCIAEFAKSIGNETVYNEFLRRSLFYKNCFDPTSGFMRGRENNGNWVSDFDPTTVGYHYTEGNAFQYSFFVPHDVYGLIQLKGGTSAFENWLDSLFETEIVEELHENSDVSGLIGNYAHGNEPSHHIAWMYAWVGNYTKLTDRIRQIITTQYAPVPGGIAGNEDCGQMSAWYVMSSTGMFPVCPGRTDYVLGLPLFKSVDFHLDNGNHFRIDTDGATLKDEELYPVSYSINGKEGKESMITHAKILNGGVVEFKTGNSAGNFALPSKNIEQEITGNVFVESGDQVFLSQTEVKLNCSTSNAEIYYTFDGSDPDSSSIKYSKPFKLNESAVIKMRAYGKGLNPGYISEVTFSKSNRPDFKNSEIFKQGLECRYYEGIYRSIYDFALDNPTKKEVVSNFNLSCIDRDEWIAMNFNGFIKIEKEGLYHFEVVMNDGGALKIDNTELFESDGRKEKAMKQHGSVWLSKGLHTVNLGFYQCSDEIKLDFKWKVPGEKLSYVPAKQLFH
nr:GH92 family glycosyl hydrolase [uncultured Carboxylicivirga sp.]